MEKIYTIPIYDCVLRVVVAKDITKARKNLSHVFGKCDLKNYEGLVSWSGGHNYGLFFTPEASKNLATVGHEVFHLTHRILEWAGVKHDKDNHESGALLCGYLMKLVMEAIETKKKGKK